MSSPGPRRPAARAAEAERNRARLLEVAAEAFGSGDKQIALESIARRAQVGIGTLYRHFPTRAALVEAVHGDQIARLRATADEPLRTLPPGEALRAWATGFLEWAVTKHGVVETLRTTMSTDRSGPHGLRDALIEILGRFLAAGAEAGTLRGDVPASDAAALLAGVLVIAEAPEQHDQALRMLDVVLDGLGAR